MSRTMRHSKKKYINRHISQYNRNKNANCKSSTDNSNMQNTYSNDSNKRKFSVLDVIFSDDEDLVILASNPSNTNSNINLDLDFNINLSQNQSNIPQDQHKKYKPLIEMNTYYQTYPIAVGNKIIHLKLDRNKIIDNDKITFNINNAIKIINYTHSLNSYDNIMINKDLLYILREFIDMI